MDDEDFNYRKRLAVGDTIHNDPPVSTRTKPPIRDHLLTIVVRGPSGSGKTRAMQQIQRLFPKARVQEQTRQTKAHEALQMIAGWPDEAAEAQGYKEAFLTLRNLAKSGLEK